MKRAGMCSLIFLALQAPAQAASGNISFGGLIDGICIILVGSAGVLDIAADGLSLSTSLGSPAGAVVTTTGTGFDVSVGTPTTFNVAPTDGNTGVTFQTEYSTTGITDVSDILGGVTTALGVGVTNVSIDMTATRADPFPPGTYNAQTVITCE